MARKNLLKINKNITKNKCTESRNLDKRVWQSKKERVKKTDSQYPVRRDMAYGRLKLFSYNYFTK